jgi:DNA-binding response OmpR family regulator
MLKEFLDMRGYDTTLAKNGLEGKERFLEKKFDLGILDVMMPKKDGFWLGEIIRSKDPFFPIIYLTAKNNRRDAIKGFEVGADDYVTKPFSMEELLLRIQAVLRRSNHGRSQKKGKQPKVLRIGKFEFNSNERYLSEKGNTQKLTSKEAQLLNLLIENKNQILERSIVLNSVWETESYFSARSMDVYISKLRKRISGDKNLEILNVHGLGFRLIEKIPDLKGKS